MLTLRLALGEKCGQRKSVPPKHLFQHTPLAFGEVGSLQTAVWLPQSNLEPNNLIHEISLVYFYALKTTIVSVAKR